MKKRFMMTAAVLSAVLFFSIFSAVVFAEETWSRPQKNERMAEQPVEKEKTIASLTGQVLHTAQWEEHRISANLYFEEKGCREEKRSRDTFWSGEKFILAAQAEGENLPVSIRLRVEGTDYTAELAGKGGVYRGELFGEEMLFQWGQREAETLSFVFTAGIDGKRCTARKEVVIDDRQPYWLLHRKR